MRRIDRYIVSTVAASMLLVLAVVVSLDLVFAFVGEAEDFKADYQALQALFFILGTLPRRIYDYLPLAAFMGSLIGLGALAKNSELVVIRAAGVSAYRLVWSAMKPAIAVVLVGLLLGEYVAPYSERIAQSKKALALGAESKIVSRSGWWHREGNTFMHFNAVQPNGVLHGVTLNTFDDNMNLKQALFAKRAIYQRGEWRLESIERTVFQKHQTHVYYEASTGWETELSPEVLNVLMVKPDNMSMSDLFQYSQYLNQQGLNDAPYMMSFWKKILQPLSTAALVLVAISFVFGPLRSVTMGFRVFNGVVIGLLFKYVQDLLGPSSLVFGFDPIFATIIPVFVCTIFGILLLRRAA